MNFSDIRALLDEEFPSFPKGRMNSYILEALQDFCESTWAFSEWQTFLTTAGTYEYTLSPSDDKTKVVGIFDDSVQFQTVDTPSPSADDSTTVGTLTSGTDYSYKVTAYSNTYGQTLPCAAVSHTCPASGSIDLDWDDVEDADGYYVYRLSGTVYGYVESTTSSAYTDDGDETPDTDITPPTKSELVRSIGLSSEKYENRQDTHWRTRESDTVEAVVWDGNTTVRLDVIPETSNMGFQMKVALTFQEETTIPDILIPHKKAIQDFVRYRIYRLPKTKDHIWNDPGESARCYDEYRSSRNQMKIKVSSGFGGPMVVRHTPFV